MSAEADPGGVRAVGPDSVVMVRAAVARPPSHAREKRLLLLEG